ncbi:hypothetical protein MARA_02020 (plasmid) [Mycolicibacterium arabiense]|uniref:Uncharacterized protein n=1 Tax=Mycolicibacterium arabiense TaxID=1286181 RepID=A0A7I7RQB9_9MYCO|nr:hypothetical protein MARA_02020 [Mycolicibacterium arabiense]
MAVVRQIAVAAARRLAAALAEAASVVGVKALARRVGVEVAQETGFALAQELVVEGIMAAEGHGHLSVRQIFTAGGQGAGGGAGGGVAHGPLRHLVGDPSSKGGHVLKGVFTDYGVGVVGGVTGSGGQDLSAVSVLGGAGTGVVTGAIPGAGGHTPPPVSVGDVEVNAAAAPGVGPDGGPGGDPVVPGVGGGDPVAVPPPGTGSGSDSAADSDSGTDSDAESVVDSLFDADGRSEAGSVSEFGDSDPIPVGAGPVLVATGGGPTAGKGPDIRSGSDSGSDPGNGIGAGRGVGADPGGGVAGDTGSPAVGGGAVSGVPGAETPAVGSVGAQAFSGVHGVAGSTPGGGTGEGTARTATGTGGGSGRLAGGGAPDPTRGVTPSSPSQPSGLSSGAAVSGSGERTVGGGRPDSIKGVASGPVSPTTTRTASSPSLSVASGSGRDPDPGVGGTARVSGSDRLGPTSAGPVSMESAPAAAVSASTASAAGPGSGTVRAEAFPSSTADPITRRGIGDPPSGAGESAVDLGSPRVPDESSTAGMVTPSTPYDLWNGLDQTHADLILVSVRSRVANSWGADYVGTGNDEAAAAFRDEVKRAYGRLDERVRARTVSAVADALHGLIVSGSPLIGLPGGARSEPVIKPVEAGRSSDVGAVAEGASSAGSDIQDSLSAALPTRSPSPDESRPPAPGIAPVSRRSSTANEAGPEILPEGQKEASSTATSVMAPNDRVRQPSPDPRPDGPDAGADPPRPSPLSSEDRARTTPRDESAGPGPTSPTVQLPVERVTSVDVSGPSVEESSRSTSEGAESAQRHERTPEQLEPPAAEDGSPSPAEPPIGFLTAYFPHSLGQIAATEVGGVPDSIQRIRALATSLDAVIADDDLARVGEAMTHEFGSHFGEYGRRWTFAATNNADLAIDLTVRVEVGEPTERIKDEEKVFRSDLGARHTSGVSDAKRTNAGIHIPFRFDVITAPGIGFMSEVAASYRRSHNRTTDFVRGENRTLRGGARSDKVSGPARWHITVAPAAAAPLSEHVQATRAVTAVVHASVAMRGPHDYHTWRPARPDAPTVSVTREQADHIVTSRSFFVDAVTDVGDLYLARRQALPLATHAPKSPGREYLQQFSTQTGLQQQLPNMLEQEYISSRIVSSARQWTALKSSARLETLKPIGTVANQQLRADRNVTRAGGDDRSSGSTLTLSLGPQAGASFDGQFVGGRWMWFNGHRGGSSSDKLAVSNQNRRGFQVNHDRVLYEARMTVAEQWFDHQTSSWRVEGNTNVRITAVVSLSVHEAAEFGLPGAENSDGSPATGINKGPRRLPPPWLGGSRSGALNDVTLPADTQQRIMQDIRAQLEVIDQPGLLPALAGSDLGGGGQPISAFSPDQRLAAEQNLRNLTSLSSLAALQVRSIEFELPKSTAEQENSVSRNMSRIADATSLSPYKDVVRIVVTPRHSSPDPSSDPYIGFYHKLPLRSRPSKTTSITSGRSTFRGLGTWFEFRPRFGPISAGPSADLSFMHEHRKTWSSRVTYKLDALRIGDPQLDLFRGEVSFTVTVAVERRGHDWSNMYRATANRMITGVTPPDSSRTLRTSSSPEPITVPVIDAVSSALTDPELDNRDQPAHQPQPPSTPVPIPASAGFGRHQVVSNKGVRHDYPEATNKTVFHVAAPGAVLDSIKKLATQVAGADFVRDYDQRLATDFGPEYMDTGFTTRGWTRTYSNYYYGDINVSVRPRLTNPRPFKTLLAGGKSESMDYGGYAISIAQSGAATLSMDAGLNWRGGQSVNYPTLRFGAGGGQMTSLSTSVTLSGATQFDRVASTSLPSVLVQYDLVWDVAVQRGTSTTADRWDRFRTAMGAPQAPVHAAEGILIENGAYRSVPESDARDEGLLQKIDELNATNVDRLEKLGVEVPAAPPVLSTNPPRFFPPVTLRGGSSSSLGLGDVSRAPDLTGMVDDLIAELGPAADTLFPERNDSRENRGRLHEFLTPLSVASLIENAIDSGAPVKLHYYAPATVHPFNPTPTIKPAFAHLKLELGTAEFVDAVADGGELEITTDASVTHAQTRNTSSTRILRARPGHGTNFTNIGELNPIITTISVANQSWHNDAAHQGSTIARASTAGVAQGNYAKFDVPIRRAVLTVELPGRDIPITVVWPKQSAVGAPPHQLPKLGIEVVASPLRLDDGGPAPSRGRGPRVPDASPHSSQPQTSPNVAEHVKQFLSDGMALPAQSHLEGLVGTEGIHHQLTLMAAATGKSMTLEDRHNARAFSTNNLVRTWSRIAAVDPDGQEAPVAGIQIYTSFRKPTVVSTANDVGLELDDPMGLYAPKKPRATAQRQVTAGQNTALGEWLGTTHTTGAVRSTFQANARALFGTQRQQSEQASGSLLHMLKPYGATVLVQMDLHVLMVSGDKVSEMIVPKGTFLRMTPDIAFEFMGYRAPPPGDRQPVAELAEYRAAWAASYVAATARTDLALALERDLPHLDEKEEIERRLQLLDAHHAVLSAEQEVRRTRRVWMLAKERVDARFDGREPADIDSSDVVSRNDREVAFTIGTASPSEDSEGGAVEQGRGVDPDAVAAALETVGTLSGSDLSGSGTDSVDSERSESVDAQSGSRDAERSRLVVEPAASSAVSAAHTRGDGEPVGERDGVEGVFTIGTASPSEGSEAGAADRGRDVDLDAVAAALETVAESGDGVGGETSTPATAGDGVRPSSTVVGAHVEGGASGEPPVRAAEAETVGTLSGSDLSGSGTGSVDSERSESVDAQSGSRDAERSRLVVEPAASSAVSAAHTRGDEEPVGERDGVEGVFTIGTASPSEGSEAGAADRGRDVDLDAVAAALETVAESGDGVGGEDDERSDGRVSAPPGTPMEDLRTNSPSPVPSAFSAADGYSRTDSDDESARRALDDARLPIERGASSEPSVLAGDAGIAAESADGGSGEGGLVAAAEPERPDADHSAPDSRHGRRSGSVVETTRASDLSAVRTPLDGDSLSEAHGIEGGDVGGDRPVDEGAVSRGRSRPLDRRRVVRFASDDSVVSESPRGEGGGADGDGRGLGEGSGDEVFSVGFGEGVKGLGGPRERIREAAAAVVARVVAGEAVVVRVQGGGNGWWGSAGRADEVGQRRAEVTRAALRREVNRQLAELPVRPGRVSPVVFEVASSRGRALPVGVAESGDGDVDAAARRVVQIRIGPRSQSSTEAAHFVPGSGWRSRPSGSLIRRDPTFGRGIDLPGGREPAGDEPGEMPERAGGGRGEPLVSDRDGRDSRDAAELDVSRQATGAMAATTPAASGSGDLHLRFDRGVESVEVHANSDVAAIVAGVVATAERVHRAGRGGLILRAEGGGNGGLFSQGADVVGLRRARAALDAVGSRIADALRAKGIPEDFVTVADPTSRGRALAAGVAGSVEQVRRTVVLRVEIDPQMSTGERDRLVEAVRRASGVAEMNAELVVEADMRLQPEQWLLDIDERAKLIAALYRDDVDVLIRAQFALAHARRVPAVAAAQERLESLRSTFQRRWEPTASPTSGSVTAGSLKAESVPTAAEQARAQDKTRTWLAGVVQDGVESDVDIAVPSGGELPDDPASAEFSVASGEGVEGHDEQRGRPDPAVAYRTVAPDLAGLVKRTPMRGDADHPQNRPFTAFLRTADGELSPPLAERVPAPASSAALGRLGDVVFDQQRGDDSDSRSSDDESDIDSLETLVYSSDGGVAGPVGAGGQATSVESTGSRRAADDTGLAHDVEALRTPPTDASVPAGPSSRRSAVQLEEQAPVGGQSDLSALPTPGESRQPVSGVRSHRDHLEAELESVLPPYAGNARDCVLRLDMLRAHFAGSSAGSPNVRPRTGARDDWAVGLKRDQDVLAAGLGGDWQPVDHTLRTVTDQLRTLGDGAMAFILTSPGTSARARHAVAIRNVGGELLWIETQNRTGSRVVPVSEMPLVHTTDARAIVIGPAGEPVPLTLSTTATPGSTVNALLDPAPTLKYQRGGIEIESGFALDVSDSTVLRNASAIIAESPYFKIVIDVVTGADGKVWKILELVSVPAAMRTGEEPGQGGAVGADEAFDHIRAAVNRLRAADPHTRLGDIFPASQPVRVNPDFADWKVIGEVFPRLMNTHYSAGIPMAGMHEFMKFVANRTFAGPNSPPAHHLRSALRFGDEVAATFAGVPNDRSVAVRLDALAAHDYEIAELRGFAAGVYTQLAAFLDHALAPDQTLAKNRTLVIMRTALGAMRAALPEAVKGWLDTNAEVVEELLHDRFAIDNGEITESAQITFGSLLDVPRDGKKQGVTAGLYLANATRSPHQTVPISQSHALLVKKDFDAMDGDLTVVELRAHGKRHIQDTHDIQGFYDEIGRVVRDIDSRMRDGAVRVPFAEGAKTVDPEEMPALTRYAVYVAELAVRRRAAGLGAVAVRAEGGGNGGRLSRGADRVGRKRAAAVQAVVRRAVERELLQRGESIDLVKFTEPGSRGRAPVEDLRFATTESDRSPASVAAAHRTVVMRVDGDFRLGASAHKAGAEVEPPQRLSAEMLPSQWFSDGDSVRGLPVASSTSERRVVGSAGDERAGLESEGDVVVGGQAGGGSESVEAGLSGRSGSVGDSIGEVGVADVREALPVSGLSVGEVKGWIGDVNHDGDASVVPVGDRLTNCGPTTWAVFDRLSGIPGFGRAHRSRMGAVDVGAATGLPLQDSDPHGIAELLRGGGAGAHTVVVVRFGNGVAHSFNALFDGENTWAIDGQHGTVTAWPPGLGSAENPVTSWWVGTPAARSVDADGPVRDGGTGLGSTVVSGLGGEGHDGQRGRPDPAVAYRTVAPDLAGLVTRKPMRWDADHPQYRPFTAFPRTADGELSQEAIDDYVQGSSAWVRDTYSQVLQETAVVVEGVDDEQLERLLAEDEGVGAKYPELRTYLSRPDKQTRVDRNPGWVVQDVRHEGVDVRYHITGTDPADSRRDMVLRALTVLREGGFDLPETLDVRLPRYHRKLVVSADADGRLRIKVDPGTAILDGVAGVFTAPGELLLTTLADSPTDDTGGHSVADVMEDTALVDVLHEMMHWLHFQQHRQRFVDLALTKLVDTADMPRVTEVSSYVGLAPFEFVAEYGVGRLLHRSYDDPVLKARLEELYVALGGPLPQDGARPVSPPTMTTDRLNSLVAAVKQRSRAVSFSDAEIEDAEQRLPVFDRWRRVEDRAALIADALTGGSSPDHAWDAFAVRSPRRAGEILDTMKSKVPSLQGGVKEAFAALSDRQRTGSTMHVVLAMVIHIRNSLPDVESDDDGVAPLGFATGQDVNPLRDDDSDDDSVAPLEFVTAHIETPTAHAELVPPDSGRRGLGKVSGDEVFSVGFEEGGKSLGGREEGIREAAAAVVARVVAGEAVVVRVQGGGNGWWGSAGRANEVGHRRAEVTRAALRREVVRQLAELPVRSGRVLPVDAVVFEVASSRGRALPVGVAETGDEDVDAAARRVVQIRIGFRSQSSTEAAHYVPGSRWQARPSGSAVRRDPTFGQGIEVPGRGEPAGEESGGMSVGPDLGDQIEDPLPSGGARMGTGDTAATITASDSGSAAPTEASPVRATPPVAHRHVADLRGADAGSERERTVDSPRTGFDVEDLEQAVIGSPNDGSARQSGSDVGVSEAGSVAESPSGAAPDVSTPVEPPGSSKRSDSSSGRDVDSVGRRDSAGEQAGVPDVLDVEPTLTDLRERAAAVRRRRSGAEDSAVDEDRLGSDPFGFRDLAPAPEREHEQLARNEEALRGRHQDLSESVADGDNRKATQEVARAEHALALREEQVEADRGPADPAGLSGEQQAFERQRDRDEVAPAEHVRRAVERSWPPEWTPTVEESGFNVAGGAGPVLDVGAGADRLRWDEGVRGVVRARLTGEGLAHLARRVESAWAALGERELRANTKELSEMLYQQVLTGDHRTRLPGGARQKRAPARVEPAGVQEAAGGGGPQGRMWIDPPAGGGDAGGGEQLDRAGGSAGSSGAGVDGGGLERVQVKGDGWCLVRAVVASDPGWVEDSLGEAGWGGVDPVVALPQLVLDRLAQGVPLEALALYRRARARGERERLKRADLDGMRDFLRGRQQARGEPEWPLHLLDRDGLITMVLADLDNDLSLVEGEVAALRDAVRDWGSRWASEEGEAFAALVAWALGVRLVVLNGDGSERARLGPVHPGARVIRVFYDHERNHYDGSRPRQAAVDGPAVGVWRESYRRFGGADDGGAGSAMTGVVGDAAGWGPDVGLSSWPSTVVAQPGSYPQPSGGDGIDVVRPDRGAGAGGHGADASDVSGAAGSSAAGSSRVVPVGVQEGAGGGGQQDRMRIDPAGGAGDAGGGQRVDRRALAESDSQGFRLMEVDTLGNGEKGYVHLVVNRVTYSVPVDASYLGQELPVHVDEAGVTVFDAGGDTEILYYSVTDPPRRRVWWPSEVTAGVGGGRIEVRVGRYTHEVSVDATYTGRRVRMRVDKADVTVVDAETGEPIPHRSLVTSWIQKVKKDGYVQVQRGDLKQNVWLSTRYAGQQVRVRVDGANIEVFADGARIRRKPLSVSARRPVVGAGGSGEGVGAGESAPAGQVGPVGGDAAGGVRMWGCCRGRRRWWRSRARTRSRVGGAGSTSCGPIGVRVPAVTARTRRVCRGRRDRRRRGRRGWCRWGCRRARVVGGNRAGCGSTRRVAPVMPGAVSGSTAVRWPRATARVSS